MRQVLVPIVALIVLGSSAALGLAPRGMQEAEEARAMTDALIADFAALPQDLPSTVALGLAIAAHEPAEIDVVESASLEAALLRLYDASGISVDRAELARQANAAAPSDAAILRELVDAAADAQLASARILAPADVAYLQTDLREKMLAMTILGETELVDVLARADMAQAAAAAMRVAAVEPKLAGLLPVEGCGRILDLPFVQVGAPCDDVYEADNILEIDYGGTDTYLNNAGSGIAGVGFGFHLDQGAGDDTYYAVTSSQAGATAGVALFVDEGGSDSYSLVNFGQAFAAAGVAVLYDQGGGDDVYETRRDPATIGTKAGGLGGVGVLRDDGGVDYYHQDGLDGFVYGAAGGTGLLLDYGSEDGDQYVSNDLYIELLGTPIGDIVGPVQVSAEVNANAILYEEGGDTSYQCGGHVRQGCQGAGGVGGLALLLDLEGNDRYALGVSISPVQANLIPVFPSGQGVAYGEGSAPPGPGIGMLRDLAGDDVYSASAYAQGYATGGLGLLLDEAGDDSYSLGAGLVGARGDGAVWLDGLALGVGVDQ